MQKHGLTEAWDIEDFVSLSKTLKVRHQDPGGGGSDLRNKARVIVFVAE